MSIAKLSHKLTYFCQLSDRISCRLMYVGSMLQCGKAVNTRSVAHTHTHTHTHSECLGAVIRQHFKRVCSTVISQSQSTATVSCGPCRAVPCRAITIHTHSLADTGPTSPSIHPGRGVGGAGAQQISRMRGDNKLLPGSSAFSPEVKVFRSISTSISQSYMSVVSYFNF